MKKILFLKTYKLWRASYVLSVLKNLPFFLRKRKERFLFVSDTASKGRGLFTRENIPAHAIAFLVEGQARFFEAKNEDECYLYPNWIGVDKNTWINPIEPHVYINHSCEPNLGIRDRREFVALRNILPGEELTFDYSITEDEIMWKMQCLCGEKNCRKVIRSIHFLPHHVYEKRLPYIPKYFQEVFTQEHRNKQETKRAPSFG